ncbi:precorrin-2 C(20)-methyltransferase [Nakamurella sp. YIM 132087]|uniref:Precorrin-2 C(20)-methyltransferase n=1 Tax=Nakamurella alba TaxID=2665158 RepID=A0A7K1FG30_9ACTN|nr:precorrin-2 C(20)-methyltransferase [Nakamurella alba]MTD13062.1 precorrin-2 C(20)-methyltransferase [Nakamurella alba]
MSSTGTLAGVGLGPGDPELITLKAARLVAAADVVAYHSGPHGRSIARTIASHILPAGVIEEALVYPVTTGETADPGGYPAVMDRFYDESAERLAVHLAAGRDVVVLCEGDPMFYGSYMYLHDRLAGRFPASVVPGVTSVSGAAAAAGLPLARHEDVLTVLPGTLPAPELARRLADTQAAAIMKLGRTFPEVRQALRESGREAGAVYVERASTADQRVLPAAEVDPAVVPYFSLVLVPGGDRRLARAAVPAAVAEPAAAPPAELLVVGLGPGPDGWVTPEVAATLGQVDHVVGYAPYVDRVPQREGLVRHASGNTVELDRASLALELALAGQRVAVVSGGDAGVFGMAAAVFEAAGADDRFAGVRIRVLPGMTAAQAVAARAGAPLGGDHAIVSLSDRLKPWSVVRDRLAALAAADLVIAIYNPASRSRTTQVADARDLLLQHRSADVPVVVGRQVGRAAESVEITTLGALDPASIDMGCLLIVGSTRTTAGSHGVWTSRSVPAAVQV